MVPDAAFPVLITVFLCHAIINVVEPMLRGVNLVEHFIFERFTAKVNLR